MSYVFAFLGLSLLIILHEAGHMWMARAFGMRVLTFSVGFGPSLLRYRGKKTTYQLAAIPLGGYVHIAGMNPEEELPPDDPGSYANKSRLAQLATLFGGPFFNYLTAVVVLIALGFHGGGVPEQKITTTVASVTDKGPAAKAGIVSRDVILSVDGNPLEQFVHLPLYLQQQKERPVKLTVRRGDKTLEVQVTAEAKKGVYQVGVAPEVVVAYRPAGAGGIIAGGFVQPIEICATAMVNLGKLIRSVFGKEKVQGGVTGPLGIIHQLSVSFKRGLALSVFFLAFLSALLAVFNLLPIPALDGSRLLFVLAGAISRRQINQKVEHTIHTVGFIILLGLMLLVSVCDVKTMAGR